MAAKWYIRILIYFLGVQMLNRVWKIGMEVIAALFVFAVFTTSCTEIGGSEFGDYNEKESSTIYFTNAEVTYNGDDIDSRISDGWVIKLYTDMDIDEFGNLIGPGSAMQLLLNVRYNEAQVADLKKLVGTYKSQSNSGDYGTGTFVWAEMATWYLYIAVNDTCIDGTEKTFGPESLVTFEVVDNMDSSKCELLTGSNLQGAQGRYTISKNGEGNYTADILVSMNDSGYKVEFDGECISHLLEPEKKTNFLSYKGEEYTVSGAILSVVDGIYTFRLANSSDNSIEIAVPESFCDGEKHGFSQSSDLSVVYNGRTYNKANGDSGTLMVDYDADNQTLTLDFTDYNEITFNYVGSVIAL